MAIAQDHVVTLHYTLKDDAGLVIDRSSDDEPLTYLHGHGHIVPGLERELTGRNAGEQVSVNIVPADGYGDHDQRLVQSVPRRTLRGVKEIKVGIRLQAHTAQGPRTMRVTRVVGDLVTLDGNHPLAGKNLNFEVRIEDVRQATAEELSHGHVHGAHGHHHD